MNIAAMGSAAAVSANKAAELMFDQRPMSHRFIVRIDRSLFDLGSWSKVSGLTVRWSQHIHRVGEHSEEKILPGNISYEPLKLSRAACSHTPDVQKWLAQTTRRRATYSGGVSLLDFVGVPILTWEFRELFPISWSMSDLDSGASQTVVETLELAHSGFLDDLIEVA